MRFWNANVCFKYKCVYSNTNVCLQIGNVCFKCLKTTWPSRNQVLCSPSFQTIRAVQDVHCTSKSWIFCSSNTVFVLYFSCILDIFRIIGVIVMALWSKMCHYIEYSCWFLKSFFKSKFPGVRDQTTKWNIQDSDPF